MNSIARVEIVIAVAAAVAAVIVVKNRTASQDELSPVTSADRPVPRLVDLGSHHCIPCQLMWGNYSMKSSKLGMKISYVIVLKVLPNTRK